jgi:hypothetical protein
MPENNGSHPRKPDLATGQGGNFAFDPLTRRDLMGVLRERNAHLIGHIEYLMGNASPAVQRRPATAPAALKELTAYAEALHTVANQSAILSFKAQRALREATGRQAMEAPGFQAGVIEELRHVSDVIGELKKERQSGRGEGTTHDHILVALVQIAEASGQPDDIRAIEGLIRIVFRVPPLKPYANPAREAEKAVALCRDRGAVNPYLFGPSGARYQLVVSEPFCDPDLGNCHRGDTISDPRDVAEVQRRHPGKTVRILLK